MAESGRLGSQKPGQKLYDNLIDLSGLWWSDERKSKSFALTPRNSTASRPSCRFSWRAATKLAYPSYFKTLVWTGVGIKSQGISVSLEERVEVKKPSYRRRRGERSIARKSILGR